MKLNYDKKSKDPTYFIQQGYRIGKKCTTKNVVRIGKHSELLKITTDPLAYAKEQVARYNEEFEKSKLTVPLTIDFDEKLKYCDSAVSSSSRLNVGYFFLQAVYDQLGLKDFFGRITSDRRITFDPNLVNRFLTYARILDPDSKLGTYDNLPYYYEKPEFNYMHISRTMDLMYEHYKDYICNLYEKSCRIVKRDTSVCYYNCTNFYFETESEDDDYVDEITGETVKGLRKYGFSKEHRPNPIVQMGLFMDGRGIPLTMCVNPGSDNEQTSAVPMEKELMEMFKGREIIYCADAGLNSFDIRSFNSMGGRKFVVTQSLKKLSEELKKAALSDNGFRLLSNEAPVTIKELKEFDTDRIKNENDDERIRLTALYNDSAYKILNADRAEDTGLYELKETKNGKYSKVKAKGVLKQDIIITFSRKFMEFQRNIRKRQIERAKKILKVLDPEKYKKGPNDVTRFIKRITNNESKDSYVIDESIIAEEEKYDGFYAVATNLDDDANTVLDINAQRYKIEDCFRVMKTNMMARPLFHRTRERITSHFMICFTALLIYRILEARLADAGFHFTVNNIIETLKNMEVTNIDDICYRATYTSSKTLTALNTIYKLELDRKNYRPKELNKKIKKIL